MPNIPENNKLPAYFWLSVAAICLATIIVSFIAVSITLTPEFSKLVGPEPTAGTGWIYNTPMSTGQRTIQFSGIRISAFVGLVVSGARLWRWI